MNSIDPVKLFIQLIYRDEPIRTELVDGLMRRWGLTDYESATAPFQGISPAIDEIGAPLFYSIVAFEKLIDPAQIVFIHRACIQLEEKYRHQGKRKIFLNAGYLDSHKVIYSSSTASPTKIYHSDGVYLDLTILFTKDKLQPLPWSFPDFKNHLYDDHFLTLKEEYKKALKILHSTPAF